MTLPQVFFKYFFIKNQLPGFCISGTLVENGLNNLEDESHCLSVLPLIMGKYCSFDGITGNYFFTIFGKKKAPSKILYQVQNASLSRLSSFKYTRHKISALRQ